MNVKKIAAVCKRAGEIRLLKAEGKTFAGTGAALYELPAELPTINTINELCAVLGYSEKERDKLVQMVLTQEELEKEGVRLTDAVEVGLLEILADEDGLRCWERHCLQAKRSIGKRRENCFKSWTLGGEPVKDKNGRPQSAPFPSMVVVFRREKDDERRQNQKHDR